MNASEKRYSPFWALLLFFAAVLVFDLDQTVKIHREKLIVMQQYAEMLRLQPQAKAQIRLIVGLRSGLLRLAPGDPVASQIVGDFHLRTTPSGR